MKKKLLVYLPLALLAGLVLTILFTWQRDWGTNVNCMRPNGVENNIRRVDCNSMNYGFPMHFVNSVPKLYVNYLGENTTTPMMLGISSSVKLSPLNFFANVVLWSALSIVAVITISVLRQKK